MTSLDRATWTLQPLAGPVPADLPAEVPATVPGTVHTDLLAAGLIPDPYLDRNEERLGWIGECDFRYATTFELDAELAPGERLDLVAEGLDTVAELRLNGVLLGRTRNQHRSYRFDLREALRPGPNELTVDFSSALREAREAEQRIGVRPRVGNPLPYNALRKMACNFGWDWGPVLVTAGIHKPIRLNRWTTARLATVRPSVRVANDTGTDTGTGSDVGTVEVGVELDRTDDTPVEVVATLRSDAGAVVAKGAVISTGATASLTLTAPDVERWWPRGHGSQSLYALEVELGADGTPLDRWSHSIGFRTAELVMEPDRWGTGFEFRVNGRTVWIKGVNWIPDDCFLPRITTADYRRGVADAVAAEANLLRIWGGGVYESDDLYELCNRAGLLVWQDFPFACAAYSEATELWDEVAAEARENVTRLMPNPSLVVWNGGNENVEGYYHWGWREQLDPSQSWGRGYYDELLPAVLAELDPQVSYVPSSPFSPHDYSRPRDPDHGSVHSWQVWNRADYTAYADDVPRFVAEFGFQGPPTWSTLTAAVHDEPLTHDSPGMLAHQKADDGDEKLTRGYRPHLPEPTTVEDWHFATQLNQARAITFGIEHFRSHWPRTTGTILWQLNDCWPVTSWSAVDGAGRRKPLWYALRAVGAPRLLTVQPRGDDLVVVLSNDDDRPWSAELEIERRSLTGTVLARDQLSFSVGARESCEVGIAAGLGRPTEPTTEVLVVTAAGARRAYRYFVDDTALDVPPQQLSLDVEPVPGGAAVTVTADAYVKDLVLFADRVHPSAVVDDALLTLFPGETHRFELSSPERVDRHALTAPYVLQSLNSLRRGGRPDTIR